MWRLGPESWSVPSIYLSVPVLNQVDWLPLPEALPSLTHSISALPDFQLLGLFWTAVQRLPSAWFSVMLQGSFARFHFSLQVLFYICI